MKTKSKPSSASNARLVAKWEKRLRAEGMPAEPIHSRKQSLSEPYEITTVMGNPRERFYHGVPPRKVRLTSDSPDGTQLAITDSSRYQYWTAFTHAVTALPDDYPHRLFLMQYSNTGYLTTTCREFKLSRRTGRTILERFVKYMETK